MQYPIHEVPAAVIAKQPEVVTPPLASEHTFVAAVVEMVAPVASPASVPTVVAEMTPVEAIARGAVALKPALPTALMGNCPETSEAKATGLLVTVCVEPAK